MSIPYKFFSASGQTASFINIDNDGKKTFFDSDWNEIYQSVSFIKLCNPDEYGGHIDLFFDRNWKEIGWQPTCPELDDETSRHFNRMMLKGNSEDITWPYRRPATIFETELCPGA
jgi:hypothetical protein